MSIQELRTLAEALPAAVFQRQLGPFALVQRPTADRSSSVLAATSTASPEVIERGMMTLLFEFEHLQVATLPPLKAAETLSIGRRMDCDLVIDDVSVSKQHAELRWNEAEGRCTVKDLGSKNGTFLNANSLSTREVVLRDGDILSFGNVQFWYLEAATLHARLRRG